MLLYHPAFDAHHGTFRMLRLLERLREQVIELDRIRILDFYSLFPEALIDFSFPRELLAVRKRLARKSNPYRSLTDPKRLFFRLEPFQVLALKTLASHDFIESARLQSDNQVKRTRKAIPDVLQKALGETNPEDTEVLAFLTGSMANIDLYGASGLKKRSDLFQYRYDAAS